MSREAIIDVVWDAPPPTAANMVQSCVGRLRQLLSAGETGSQGCVQVSAGPRGYVPQATADQLDLLEFRAAW